MAYLLVSFNSSKSRLSRGASAAQRLALLEAEKNSEEDTPSLLDSLVESSRQSSVTENSKTRNSQSKALNPNALLRHNADLVEVHELDNMRFSSSPTHDLTSNLVR